MIGKKSNNNDCGPGDIPTDILREIIVYSDIDTLRNLLLVDRRCNTLANEHLNRNIPRIETISIHCHSQTDMTVSLTIPKKHSLYYRDALSNFSIDNFAGHSDEIHLSMPLFDKFPDHINQLEAMAGLRVGSAKVDFSGNREASQRVEELLGLWSVDCLDIRSYELTEWKSDFILNVLDKFGIVYLNIDLTDCTVRCPRKLLLKLSNRLHALSITQWINYKYPPNGDQQSNYLFGMINHDWVKLISEMFAKNLYCLHIMNRSHAHLQTKNDLQRLLKIISSNDDDNILLTSFPLYETAGIEADGIKRTVFHNGRMFDVQIRNPRYDAP